MFISPAYAATTESSDNQPVEAAATTTETYATTEAGQATASSGGVGAGLAALGVDGKLLVAQIINFIILFLVLRKFVYKPLLGLLESRRSAIETGLEQAKEIEKRYAAFQTEHAERVDAAKKEVATILDEGKQAAESLRKETLEQTQRETEQLLTRAHQEIEREKQKMLAEVKKEIGTLAIEATKKLIGKSIDPKTQSQLLSEAISEVKE